MRCRWRFRTVRRWFFTNYWIIYPFIFRPINLINIFVDIEFTQLWLNWDIFINRGRPWRLYYVVAFRYEGDELAPIRMNVMFFLVDLLSITILVLDTIILTLLNSYYLKNVIHLSFSAEIDVSLLTFFWWIRPHVLIIDYKNAIFKSK